MINLLSNTAEQIQNIIAFWNEGLSDLYKSCEQPSNTANINIYYQYKFFKITLKKFNLKTEFDQVSQQLSWFEGFWFCRNWGLHEAIWHPVKTDVWYIPSLKC